MFLTPEAVLVPDACAVDRPLPVEFVGLRAGGALQLSLYGTARSGAQASNGPPAFGEPRGGGRGVPFAVDDIGLRGGP